MVIDLKQAQEVIRQIFKDEIDNEKRILYSCDIADMAHDINQMLSELPDAGLMMACGKPLKITGRCEMKKCKYPDVICGLATVVKGISYCNSVPCSLKDEVRTVKCKDCKNNHLLFAEDIKGEKIPFHFCNKVNDSLNVKEKRQCEHFELATNFDVIRNMKPEELADIIMCPMNVDPESCIGNEKHCIKCCLEWLNKPVEG